MDVPCGPESGDCDLFSQPFVLIQKPKNHKGRKGLLETAVVLTQDLLLLRFTWGPGACALQSGRGEEPGAGSAFFPLVSLARASSVFGKYQLWPIGLTPLGAGCSRCRQCGRAVSPEAPNQGTAPRLFSPPQAAWALTIFVCHPALCFPPLLTIQPYSYHPCPHPVSANQLQSP